MFHAKPTFVFTSLMLGVMLTAACAVDGASGDALAQAPAATGAAEPAPVSPEAEKLNQGRMIAYTECASCHAVGTSGPSPREDAPPLRSVLARYNTASLEMDLMEGMRVGHADMPRFTFDPRTVDALIVYLESIQDWGLAYRPDASVAR